MHVTMQQADKMCFRIDDPGLKVGDVIEHGRWGQIVQGIGEAHNQFARESMLERIRSTEFADKPSRLTGTFAFAYFEDADKFHEMRWNDGSKQLMYQVVPVDSDAAYHMGYMRCLPPIAEYDAEDVCRAYWSFAKSGFGFDFRRESFVEIVFDCPLQVVGICSQV